VGIIMKKLIFALMLTCGLSASAMAQVNTREGACEDSSCSRRSLSLLNSTSNSSSSTTAGGSGGSPVIIGVISAPASLSCAESTAYGPDQACPTGYTGTWRSTTVTQCPGGEFGDPVVSSSDNKSTQCVGSAYAPPATPSSTPTPTPSCIPGMGSTINGEPGYCIDCDDVAWVDGPFAANRTGEQRACWTRYNTQPVRMWD
jgi:hypothetical protein